MIVLDDVLTMLVRSQNQKTLFIIAVHVQGGQTVYTLERKIALSAIRTISMSTLRDDWLVSKVIIAHSTPALMNVQAINLGPTEEGDPFISCVFKTELVTHLLRLTSASINVNIGPTYVVKAHRLCVADVHAELSIPRRRRRRIP